MRGLERVRRGNEVRLKNNDIRDFCGIIFKLKKRIMKFIIWGYWLGYFFNLSN